MSLTTSKRYGLWYRQVTSIALLFVVLLSAACVKGAPTPVFTETADYVSPEAMKSPFETPTGYIVSVDTAFSIASGSLEDAQDPATTPTPIPTPIGPCTWNADYVEDGNLQDGFLVQPATPIRKVWRLVNNGSCPWIEGISLEIVAGDQLHIQPQSNVSQTALGMIGDIELAFVSPGNPGTYATYLRMRSPDGDLFGSVVFVKFSVSSTAPLLAGADITEMQVIPLPQTHEPTQVPSTPMPVAPAATEPPAAPTAIAATSTPWPTLSPSATPRATVAPTNTRVPTETPTTTPAPTSTVTATTLPSETPDPGISFGVAERVEACDYTFDLRLINAKDQADTAGLGLPECPSGSVRIESGSIQEFTTTPNTGDKSLMLWQMESGHIRIFQGYSRAFGNFMSVRNMRINWPAPSVDYLAACNDTVVDDAPSSFVMPMSNFGYLWCEQKLHDTLGWSLAAEKPVKLVIQEMDGGVLMQVTSGGQRLYDIAINTTTGQGIILP